MDLLHQNADRNNRSSSLFRGEIWLTAVVSFPDLYYHHISISIEVTHNARLSLIVYTGTKLLPPTKPGPTNIYVYVYIYIYIYISIYDRLVGLVVSMSDY